ncbi:MAG: hypothetical protein ACRD0U_08480 [Acidimicrobiales bacterium]
MRFRVVRIGTLVVFTVLTVACSSESAPPETTPSSGAPSFDRPGTELDEVLASETVVVSPLGVLGWWDGERWVQWHAGIEVPLHGGEQYLTLTIATRGAAVGGAPQPASGEGCGLGAELAPVVRLTGEDGAVDNSPIGVTGPAVRLGGDQPGEELSGENAEYQALAREALASIGVDDGDPHLAQVVRTDIQSDGTDEALLVAEQVSPGGGVPGDYSALILQELVDGVVLTKVLHESIAEGSDETGQALVSTPRVAALVDINGDGSIELIVTYRLGESAATSVIDLPGSTAREVLTAECPN